MPSFIKVSKSFSNVQDIYCKVSSAWNECGNVYVKKNGTWNPIWSYSWKTGDWGNCSAACGGGVQTREVTCYRSDGIIKSDSLCIQFSGEKPATSKPCNTQACGAIYKYQWYDSCGPNAWLGRQTTTITGEYSSFVLRVQIYSRYGDRGSEVQIYSFKDYLGNDYLGQQFFSQDGGYTYNWDFNINVASPTYQSQPWYLDWDYRPSKYSSGCPNAGSYVNVYFVYG